MSRSRDSTTVVIEFGETANSTQSTTSANGGSQWYGPVIDLCRARDYAEVSAAGRVAV